MLPPAANAIKILKRALRYYIVIIRCRVFFFFFFFFVFPKHISIQNNKTRRIDLKVIYRLTRIYTCRGKLHCYTNAKSVSACSRCRAQIEIFHVLKSVMVLLFLGFYYNRVRGFCAINTNICTKSTLLRLILPHPCSFHGLLFNYNLFLRRPPGPLSLELSFRPPF